jgi:acetyl esterase/lipase
MPDDQSSSITEVIDLWPEGPPTVLPKPPPESFTKVPNPLAGEIDIYRNVSHPTMTVYRPNPDKANGVGVIVCPGGGWQILVWGHEGVDLAEWLTGRGNTAMVLKYRLSATPADTADYLREAARHADLLTRPMMAAETPRSLDHLMSPAMMAARGAAAEDGRRALNLTRQRAGDLGVDPAKIGLIGFSAGAFLVADVAMDPGGAPPAFVAPIYGGETRGKPVPADAPPLFTAVAQDDRMLVSIVRGLADDWFDADRPVENHLFPRGGHGFGTLTTGAPTDVWLGLFEMFLAGLGLS